MADDAIRNGAVARKVGQELLFEAERQGIIDIGGERLRKEVLHHLWGFPGRSKDGR